MKMTNDKVRVISFQIMDSASCQRCNLQARTPRSVPVAFHNLKGYDSHLIIKNLTKNYGKITCIPNTEEKYMSFTIGGAKFIDTFQFLSSSLSKLVDNLYEEGKGAQKFTNTISEFPNDPEGLKLLMRKIPYPYEYMSSEEVLDRSEIIAQDKFYDSLNERHMSNADYDHYLKIMNHFKFNNNREYHDLYLKLDVCLLADVFENMRSDGIKKYSLDPVKYLTLPSYSWDAMLKMTKINLELLTDLEKYMFFEEAKRGGISVITGRFSKANNKYMKSYDKTKKSKYIIYLDMNNLYGGAMCEPLPYGGFEWIENPDLNTILNTPDNHEHGFYLKISGSYPKKLHDLHNDYPIMPENEIIKNKEMSGYTRKIMRKFNDDGKEKINTTPKLIASLKDKKEYVIHYRNLKQAVSLGFEVTQVHKVMRFKQSDWLKVYIDKNTEFRKEAKSEFEKDFYKLMNNSVFGKTMENVRNRINFELVNDHLTMLEKTRKPTFKKRVRFNEKLYGVHMMKTKVVLNKPIYVGATILDLSKYDMYNFHYGFMKEKYGNKARLLFTDTDSLCYEVECEDIYQDIHDNKELFDLSNYSENHFCYDATNKKKLKKMKDETEGYVITEFVGLRSKMYSFQYEVKDEIKSVSKGKGIKVCKI
eukprot:Lithocolla_globosa_v1_NODE_30_length_9033_cov_22.154583.p1 type:complete len:645 gc:universal NODE_30_length_9033_cov_22.154583:4840-2906(-)